MVGLGISEPSTVVYPTNFVFLDFVESTAEILKTISFLSEVGSIGIVGDPSPIMANFPSKLSPPEIRTFLRGVISHHWFLNKAL